MRALILFLAAVLVPGGAGCAGSPPGLAVATKDISPVQATVPGEYIVTLAPGADPGAVSLVYGRFGIARIQDLGHGVVLVALEQDPGLARMKELQGLDPRLKAVQPNFVYKALK